MDAPKGGAPRVTILLENESERPELLAAHGLSMLVEAKGLRVLLDAGPDDKFAHNAESLGLDLRTVDALVLSHGHKDHGGGLEAFLSRNAKAPVYARRSAFEPHYWRMGLRLADVGLPRIDGSRLSYVEDELELAPGIRLFGTRLRTGFQPPSNALSRTRRDGRLLRDEYDHEILLSIEEGGKLYLFTGCSHSGVTAMMEEAVRRSGGLPVARVVGGFHLFHSPWRPFRFRRDMAALAEDLAAYEGTVYHTGHCSVPDALARLSSRLGARISRFKTGDRLEF